MRIGSRLLILLAAAAFAAAGLAVPTAAFAEKTSLCLEDTAGSACPEGKVAKHIHLISSTKGKLLSSLVNVECTVLFLGDPLTGTSEPLVIHGNFTYSSCEVESKSGCTVSEVSSSALINVLKTGVEEAEVTGTGEVLVECGTFIHCVYNGTGLKATAKGPLEASNENGETSLQGQTLNKVSGFLCPKTSKLDLTTTPLEKTYIAKAPPPSKTALCTTDEAESTCSEANKPSSIDFKDGVLEFLTNLLNFQCEGLVSGSVGEAGKPQEVKATYTYSGCGSGCVVTEVSGGSKLFFLGEGGEASELAQVTTEEFELFVKCGTTIKCTFGPIKLAGDGFGALKTGDNGHITFSKASLGEHEGTTCPSEASLDALYVASSATYIREDYLKPPTSLCSKDEGSPYCKSENQLKTIDYSDKALELLTNLINVKCEGLVSGSVGEPGSSLEVKPELTFSNCGGGCFVTVVSGPGKIVLERTKSEEAKATTEGFEIFVKCGTTIKCLLGPEKMVGTALGALTTADNGHLTFSKASMGKGEGATCPKEATLDATYVASSAAYIG